MMDNQGRHPLYLPVTCLHMKNAALPFASHQNMFVENIYKILVFRVFPRLANNIKALVSMMEKGFFDSSGEEEVYKILTKMDEERDVKHKIKRRQEIHRHVWMQKNEEQKTVFAVFESSRCLTSSETTSSSTTQFRY